MIPPVTNQQCPNSCEQQGSSSATPPKNLVHHRVASLRAIRLPGMAVAQNKPTGIDENERVTPEQHAKRLSGRVSRRRNRNPKMCENKVFQARRPVDAQNTTSELEVPLQQQADNNEEASWCAIL